MIRCRTRCSSSGRPDRTARSCGSPGRCTGTAGPSPAGVARPPTTPGYWSFSTLAPGPSRPGAASFFALTVFARGLLDRLRTRVYLPDSEASLAADPLLSSLPAERRRTLVAAAEPGGFAFDVVLQGAGETVFLESRP